MAEAEAKPPVTAKQGRTENMNNHQGKRTLLEKEAGLSAEGALLAHAA